MLGRGGFGSVFRAVHANTGQDVAIKVLRPQASWTPDVAAAQAARFEREAEICASMHHPNIVRLLGRGQTKTDLCYAIYEHVPGETLRNLLEREGALSVDRTAELMAQVLDALATAHGKGVVHRDLKPENIMVLSTGLSVHAKVLDFGIGTLTLEARDTAFNDLTGSNEMLGTAYYSAPEQLRGDPPTIKTDLYAWGLVFLECITGQRPIVGGTLAEIYHQHLSPLELSLPPSIVDHSLGAFLRKVLFKEQDKRAGDAMELYAGFRQLHLGDLVGRLNVVSQSQRVIQQKYAAEQLRQVTVIAFNLQLHPTADSTLDTGRFDALLDDQLNLCRDALARYGGTVIGHLADLLVALFGYPNASDTDARLAVRTVLDLSRDIRKRSERMAKTHSCRLQFRIGLHTGPVMVRANRVPTGATVAKALALATNAIPNTIIVSAPSAQLVKPFVELVPGVPVSVNGQAQPLNTSQLAGERRSEALTFKPTHSGAATLVGREDDLAQLQRLVRDQSSPPVILITGQAGIGKTRVVWELLRLLRHSGHAIYECRCYAERRNTALSPVLELVRGHLGLQGQSSMQAGQALIRAVEHYGLNTKHLVSILCMWLSIPYPAGYAPTLMASRRQRELLLDVLVKILSRLNEDERTVLVFEDLHWADPTTIELISRLTATETMNAPQMLCTARPDFNVTWAEERLSFLRLHRLTADQARQFILELWQHDELDSETLAAIVERADGIPLFLEEIVQMLQEQSSRPSRSDVTSIPSTLRALLASQLDRLGEARAVAQLAAVLGREFEGHLLYAVAGLDDEFVGSALNELIKANLLYRRLQVESSAYVFRHALIQGAAYDSMPREARLNTHARVAELLERQGSVEPEAIARHWTGADNPIRAIRSWRRACERAEAEAAYVEAIAHTDEALQLISKLAVTDQPHVELELQIVRRRLLIWVKGFATEEYTSAGERIRVLSEQLGSKEAGYDTLRNIWLTALLRGEISAAEAAARELGRIAESNAVERGVKMMATATSLGPMCHSGNFRNALDCAISLVEQGRDNPIDKTKADERQALIAAYSYVIFSATLLDLPSLAEKYETQALELAKGGDGNPMEHVQTLITIAHKFAWRRDAENLLRITEQVLSHCTTPVYALFAGEANIFSGWAIAITGDFERGLEMLCNGIENRRRSGQRINEEFNLSLLAEAQLAAGDLEGARSTLEDAEAIITESRWMLAEVLRMRGRCEEASGDRAAAINAYQQAFVLADEFDIRLSMRLAKEDLHCVKGM